MRTTKSLRSVRTRHAAEMAEAVPAVGTEADDAYETYEIFRVDCPECGQPIALLAEEETLPEHALCTARWDPFGMTVCPGSGRAATEAPPSGREAQEEDAAALLTLPAGLDWRTQPFSHAGPARPQGSGLRPAH